LVENNGKEKHKVLNHFDHSLEGGYTPLSIMATCGKGILGFLFIVFSY